MGGLYDEMKEKEMSVSDLSIAIGTKESNIKNWLIGNSKPSANNTKKLKDAGFSYCASLYPARHCGPLVIDFKVEMKLKGYNTISLGKAVGVSSATISAWSGGPLGTRPSEENIKKLKALGFSDKYLAK